MSNNAAPAIAPWPFPAGAFSIGTNGEVKCLARPNGVPTPPTPAERAVLQVATVVAAPYRKPQEHAA